MKVTLENFRKIQEYKKLGLSQKKTATNLSLTLTSVRKWWDSTEDDLLNAENTRAEYLDNYKEFMLSKLHTCSQIKVTNLFSSSRKRSRTSSARVPRSIGMYKSCVMTMAMTITQAGRQNQENRCLRDMMIIPHQSVRLYAHQVRCDTKFKSTQSAIGVRLIFRLHR